MTLNIHNFSCRWFAHTHTTHSSLETNTKSSLYVFFCLSCPLSFSCLFFLCLFSFSLPPRLCQMLQCGCRRTDYSQIFVSFPLSHTHTYTAAVLWSRKPISALTTFWKEWVRGCERGEGESEFLTHSPMEGGGGIRRSDVCLEWGSYGESMRGRKIASGMILGLSY